MCIRDRHKLVVIFIDSNERHIILENPESEIGEFKNQATDVFISLGCKFFSFIIFCCWFALLYERNVIKWYVINNSRWPSKEYDCFSTWSVLLYKSLWVKKKGKIKKLVFKLNYSLSLYTEYILKCVGSCQKYSTFSEKT